MTQAPLMTRTSFIALGALAAFAAAPASAQSLPQGFYLKGRAQADYIFASGPDRDFQSADMSFGVGGRDAPWAVPLGFDVGLKGFRSGRGDLSESVLYASVGLATEMGTFSVGAPRPATSAYFPLPRIGGSQAFAAFAGTGVTTTDTLGLFGDRRTVGLRYDYGVDDVTVALSYHHFSNSTAETLSGLVAYETGPFTLALGIEHAARAENNGTDLAFRVAYDQLDWGGSAMVASTSVIDTRTVALDAYYAPRDDIRLTASYARFDVEGDGDSVYGVAAEYTFPTNAYVGIGITQSDIRELDARYTAFFGWKFDY